MNKSEGGTIMFGMARRTRLAASVLLNYCRVKTTSGRDPTGNFRMTVKTLQCGTAARFMALRAVARPL